MFKLVVLSALLVVAAARPSHLETPIVYSAPVATVAVQETSLAHVGNVVKSVPSAVSHHSNSVVHSHAHVVEDIVAPVVKTTAYTTKTLAATPIVESYDEVPVVKSYAAPAALHSYAAPAGHSNYAAAGPAIHSTYAAAGPAIHSTYAAAAPAVHATYAAELPVAHTYAATAPVYEKYFAAPQVHAYAPAGHYAGVNTYAASSPLTYSATGLW